MVYKSEGLAKIWLIIIIVAAIILVGVGSYFAYAYYTDHHQKKSSNKKSDPYSGWLTYTNDEVGYKLKYPSKWTIKETSGKSEITGEQVNYITITSTTGNFLHFGLQKKGETSFNISDRTGIGAGEDQPLTDKTTTFLKCTITPKAHVWQSKTKEFFYSIENSCSTTCNCQISISFSPASEVDEDTLDMSTTELKTVNLILASVKWTSASNNGSSSGNTESAADKLTQARDVVKHFLDARITRNLENAKPYVTDSYYSSTNQEEFAGVSSPSLGAYEIASAQLLPDAGFYEVKATIHWYLQGVENNTSTWTFHVVVEGGKYLVNEVQGGYE